MALFTRSAKRVDAERSVRTKATFDELARVVLGDVVPISSVQWRDRVKVAGRVKSMRIQPWAEQVAGLELTLADSTGAITVVFLGRRKLGGIHLGTHLVIDGVTSEHHGLLTVLNPSYQLLPNQIPLPH